MRRREFIAGFAGAAMLMRQPPAGWAQKAGRIVTIGFMGADPVGWRPWLAAFVEHLRSLGWAEDRTVAFAIRWTEGRPERAAEIAAEFVRLNVDAIITYGTAVAIVQQATSVIPIIFPMGIDPVRSG